MRPRRLLAAPSAAAALSFALLAGGSPAAAVAPPAAPSAVESSSAAVVVQFTGVVTLGCLNCWEPGGIVAMATVVHGGGVASTTLDATLREDTTPDPCPVLLQADGEFRAGDLTGSFYWLRSLNEIAITVYGVDGYGLRDGSGVGTATVVANPARLALEGCGSENVSYLVEGVLTIAPPSST